MASEDLTPSSTPTASRRLLSLDVFRGLTIAGMIVVNTPGTWAHVYPPLLHAEWHGWTYTDTIFPFFLFIVGVSMAISFGRRRSQGGTRRELLRHSIQRGLIIFGLGLALNVLSFFLFHREHVRIPGVLQRIGVVYLVASAIYLAFGRRGVVAATVVLLLGYWALMSLVPVPGYGAGQLDVEGNLAAYVDRVVLGSHTWKPGWDPEGPLSTIPAVATTLLGALAGEWLIAAKVKQQVTGLMMGGALGTVLGAIWGRVFPINKNLWTSSYSLFMSGLAAVSLALCLWVVDEKGWKGWARPFEWLGRNPIAAFVVSTLVTILILAVKLPGPEGKPRSLYATIYRTVFDRFTDARLGSLLFALAYLAFWVAVCGLLYRKRVFVKI
ncbi:MAG TPA: heparan-alpha-glucosaminide N-acetyltransferase domain-containing protein [Thermoanaerobaculia bacterium]|nr:heparan-alpha-glucosaminide N-acetyltransferase domain-containing protein [Thermoanaerobaculia bacterium]